VRACALATNNNAVLMMLYANGYGVARDTDRAIHHACILDFIAKSEMEHRIARPSPAGTPSRSCAWRPRHLPSRGPDPAATETLLTTQRIAALRKVERYR
jgi:hypothetical protein